VLVSDTRSSALSAAEFAKVSDTFSGCRYGSIAR